MSLWRFSVNSNSFDHNMKTEFQRETKPICQFTLKLQAEEVVKRCYVKKVFLKILQNSQENIIVGVF